MEEMATIGPSEGLISQSDKSDEKLDVPEKMKEMTTIGPSEGSISQSDKSDEKFNIQKKTEELTKIDQSEGSIRQSDELDTKLDGQPTIKRSHNDDEMQSEDEESDGKPERKKPHNDYDIQSEDEDSDARYDVDTQSEASDVTHVRNVTADFDNPITIEYDNDVSVGVRGILHIFNYYEFYNSEMDFHDGKAEGEEVMEVFTALKYKVKLHCNLTEMETDQAFEDIQRTEGLSEDNVLIFFILSHGGSRFNFKSSDCEDINLLEKMQLFRTDKCNAMAYQPKVWFGDFCHGRKDQRGVSWHEKKRKAGNFGMVKRYGKQEALTNTLHILSSGEGFAGVSSKFSKSVCEMLQEGKCKLNDKWRADLNRKLRKKEAPNSSSQYYDPFPGQLFDDEFSFDYDVEEVNRRKPEKR